MISQLSGAGIRILGGFTTTAQAYREFLAQSGLSKRTRSVLAQLALLVLRESAAKINVLHAPCEG